MICMQLMKVLINIIFLFKAFMCSFHVLKIFYGIQSMIKLAFIRGTLLIKWCVLFYAKKLLCMLIIRHMIVLFVCLYYVVKTLLDNAIIV